MFIGPVNGYQGSGQRLHVKPGRSTRSYSYVSWHLSLHSEDNLNE